MTIDKINRSLKERFSQPLKDCYERRIVFWFDPERQFESILPELDLPNVKLLHLRENDLFAAKRLLSETDTASDYLVYDTLVYADYADNWLRDIQLYSEEFRADLISILMDELNIPQTFQLRRAMKHYIKFFEKSKERKAKFVALGTNYENPGQLHISIMAVLSGTKQNTVSGVLRAILCDSLYNEDNRALAQIQKFGSEQAFWEMAARYTGYCDDKRQLSDLAVHILLTAFSTVGDDGVLAGLERFITPENQPACYAFIDEWNSSSESGRLFDIAADISERFGLAARLEKLDTEALLRSDGLPCVDEAVVGRYMKEIGEGTIKIEEILKACESRRTSKWYDRFAYLYDGLYYIAQMQKFHYDHISGFHFGTYAELWKEYVGGAYIMDTYYRRLHIAFRKSLVNSSGELDDLFKQAMLTAENIYKGGYLAELNGSWCALIKNSFSGGFALPDILQQKQLFSKKIEPLIRDSGRVFVIISDALRYETAAELCEKLVQETHGTADISAVQSVFPSITKLGMAALLPHETLSLTDDMKVLCDGEPADGTDSRDKILKKYSPKNCAVTYEALISMNKQQRRELVSGADMVYIYHNKIDAVGDKASTERQIFEACAEAVEELKNLVRLIANSMSGSNIIITADHGFLYSHEALCESEKADTDLVTGAVRETGRRYIIADKNSSSDILMKIPLDDFSPNLAGFTPYENVRLKKQGGGMNYVHGGVSLQECCVPVITFKNIRAGSKHFVDIKKVKIKLISTTRRIGNNIFSLSFMQTEPVGGKTVPAVYEVYFCDRLSKPVSDVLTVSADKAGEPQELVYNLRFTLKNADFDSSAAYYLNIVDKETGDIMERTEFSIKIAFANDFDF